MPTSSELPATPTTVTVLTVLPIALLLALAAWVFPHPAERPPAAPGATATAAP
ncbi:hypothetical protein ABT093_26150 [Kitasatospora sp. NPDC002551]|uniref:hypothetical protein n=1 Tax=unclassified Kitasatospora TaxID=2633591 RepID=UPI00331B0DD8